MSLHHNRSRSSVHPTHSTVFFFLLIPPPPRSTLFPYTTLFRSQIIRQRYFPNLLLTTQENQQVRLYDDLRSEEHTSELQSHSDLVCRLLLEKKKNNNASIRLAFERPLTCTTTNHINSNDCLLSR